MAALWLCILRCIVVRRLLRSLERLLSPYCCFLILLCVLCATPALQVQSIASLSLEWRHVSSGMRVWGATPHTFHVWRLLRIGFVFAWFWFACCLTSCLFFRVSFFFFASSHCVSFFVFPHLASQVGIR